MGSSCLQLLEKALSDWRSSLVRGENLVDATVVHYFDFMHCSLTSIIKFDTARRLNHQSWKVPSAIVSVDQSVRVGIHEEAVQFWKLRRDRYDSSRSVLQSTTLSISRVDSDS